MDLGLKGRTAVVTAASSGLGRQVAGTLAAEGANLILFARTQSKLDDAAREFEAAHGVKVTVVAGDMRQRTDVERLAAAVEAAGGADVLVLNTGRPPQPMLEVLEERDEQKWRDGYEVQLWGAIQVLSTLVPPMVARGYGRVVAVTSATVKQPMVKHGLSTVFRAGLTGYLKHLANEIAHTGVTVNCVCPALILTDGLKSSYNIEARAAAIPMKRGGKPEELAATVAFFCSRLSGYTTGASLQVDGGQVAALASIPHDLKAQEKALGPLNGLKIVEMAGIGPGPMCAMLLAELGANVIRIERKEPAGIGIPRPRKYDLLLRSRPAIAVDLKSAAGVDLVKRLVASSDGLIEGFRPGVMERLGLGPDVCLGINPKLVFGRITGWGQDGPLAQVAGHDLNYIALTGALNAMGRAGQPPTVPLTVIGDFGGGALYLALGMLAGLMHARSTGQGQVVDAAMLDGALSLLTVFFGLRAAGVWNDERGNNITDSGSHFCEVYECADGKWVAIAPIEPKFYQDLLRRIGLDDAEVGKQMDRANWPRAKEKLAAVFRTKTRAEWTELLGQTDTCFSPVMSWAEAPEHPHVAARRALVEVEGVTQPAPAPRFSATPLAAPVAPRDPAAETNAEALAPWLDAAEFARFREAGAIS